MAEEFAATLQNAKPGKAQKPDFTCLEMIIHAKAALKLGQRKMEAKVFFWKWKYNCLNYTASIDFMISVPT